jgi:protein-tyrosine phosphatase
MIDTHCHLLPALDDGPRRLDESVMLARQLRSAGVSRVVCTPHFSRRFPTDHRLATARLNELRLKLASAGIALELQLAAEIAPSAALESERQQLERRHLGSRHLLVEVDRDTPAGFLELLLSRLRKFGRVPVLAHPERCPALHSQPHLLDAARAQGALVQVVAPSLTGRSGETAERAAWRLLESDRVDLLASDAHRPGRQGLSLTRALPLLVRRLGRERVRALTEDAPAMVLGHLAIQP